MMKFASLLLAGASTFATAFREAKAVFEDVRSAVSASPLPPNIKKDTLALMDDVETDLASFAGVAGTELGAILSGGLERTTTSFAGLVEEITKAKPISELTPADKAAVSQAGKVLITQITTMATQYAVGIDPTKSAPAQQQKGAQPQPGS